MRMLYAIVFGACLLPAAPSAASAQAPDCGNRALQLWQQAIDDERGSDAERAQRIALLYAQGNSGNEVLFLPTASPDLVTTRAGITAYFTSFVAPKPKVTFTECRSIALPGNVTLFAGFYYFRNTRDCPQGRLLARYSFLIRPGTNNFIMHHHSSVLPGGNPCQTQ